MHLNNVWLYWCSITLTLNFYYSFSIDVLSFRTKILRSHYWLQDFLRFIWTMLDLNFKSSLLESRWKLILHIPGVFRFFSLRLFCSLFFSLFFCFSHLFWFFSFFFIFSKQKNQMLDFWGGSALGVPPPEPPSSLTRGLL